MRCRFRTVHSSLFFGSSVLAVIATAPEILLAPLSPARAEEAAVADIQVTNSGDGQGELARPVLQAQRKPRAIVVVDPQTIERENINRLDELQLKVPNYRANNGTTAQAARQTIRWIGIGAGTGVGTESPTGFVVDNVFWKYWGFQWGDFVDLSSFEVALGPQGTAGGKNTAVGNIIIRTQLPSFKQRATVETNFANYSRVIEKVNITGPIIDDTLAYRVTGYLDKGDGWIRDKISDATYMDTNRWGVRGQLLYTGDNITDRLIFTYNKSDEYNGYTTGAIGDSFLVYANGARPSATFAQNVWKRLGKPILSFDPYNPALARQGVDPVRNIMASNELNVAVGDNIFTSISAYGFSRNEQRYFSDNNNLLELWRGGMNTYVGQGSQEFRLSSPKDQDLEWVTGVYLFYDDAANQMHHTQFGVDAKKWLNMPGALPGVENWWHTKARDIQLAAYGQATYHIDEQWAATLGLRDSYEIRQGSVSHLNRYHPTISWFDQDQAIIAAGGYGLSDRGGETKRGNALMGIFNPQYRYDENVLFYGLLGRAEKAAAVNTSGNPRYVDRKLANGATIKVFDSWPALFTQPEVSWDYELGVKTNWFDNHLLFNVNLYWNDFYNFQTNTTDTSRVDALGSPLRMVGLGNAAHARLRGVEVDGRWSPIERLWINFNGAFSDARWVSYPDAAPPSDWLWPASLNNGGPKAPLMLSRSNTRWEKVPMWTFNIGANYEQPIGPAFADFGDWARQPVTAFGYVNVSWQSKTQLTDPNSIFQYWQDAYAIVNAGAGLRTDDNNYTVTLWGKNLTNELPYNAWSPGDASTPANVGITRWPRTYGASLRVRI